MAPQSNEDSSFIEARLLKDAGCSSNAARLCQLFGADDRTLKHDHKPIDWTQKGPAASREMTAARCERGADIVQIAQAFEVFFSAQGVGAASEVIRRRSGTWFDPALVRAMEGFEDETALWRVLEAGDPRVFVDAYEPDERVLAADEDRVHQVAQAFALVIDAKSPYTFHPAFTYEILRRIGRFRDVAEVAASHHERLDGTGYHRGVGAADLSRPARVLAAADVCEALQAERPYRGRPRGTR